MNREDVGLDPYANAVLRALVGDFPEVRDFTVANVVRKYVFAHRRTNCGLEVIVDSPVRANWRLTANSRKPKCVRLGCWKQELTEADHERLERINEALSQIPEAPDEHPLRRKAPRHR